MIPRQNINLPDLTQVNIFVGAGKNDPLVPKEETKKLIQLLINANAKVVTIWTNTGHKLSHTEIIEMKSWYKKLRI